LIRIRGSNSAPAWLCPEVPGRRINTQPESRPAAPARTGAPAVDSPTGSQRGSMLRPVQCVRSSSHVSPPGNSHESVVTADLCRDLGASEPGSPPPFGEHLQVPLGRRCPRSRTRRSRSGSTRTSWQRRLRSSRRAPGREPDGIAHHVGRRRGASVCRVTGGAAHFASAPDRGISPGAPTFASSSPTHTAAALTGKATMDLHSAQIQGSRRPPSITCTPRRCHRHLRRRTRPSGLRPLTSAASRWPAPTPSGWAPTGAHRQAAGRARSVETEHHRRRQRVRTRCCSTIITTASTLCLAPR
jgi:hypothetical protein